MKLQLAVDTVRVRLSAAEFAALCAGGVVAVELPVPGSGPLCVALRGGPAFAIAGPGMQLELPAADLAALAARLPCREGLEYAVPAGEVRILVDVDVRDRPRAPR